VVFVGEGGDAAEKAPTYRANVMFRLVATVRRGSASNLAAAWAQYPTLDAARVGATALLREDRVLRVMIVSDEVPPTFIEWVER
jgi:hypothetical protein